jgi:hypothetical protein
MEPEEPRAPKQPAEHGVKEPDARRGALVGLVLILLLVVGGLLLSHILRSMSQVSQVQDCALSGRSNCT